MMAGVDMVHVPYRGGGAGLTDLLAGQLQVMFASMSSSIEYVRAGKLRALAVTTSTRSPVLADIPTVAEFVPGYEASFWTGIGGRSEAELPARYSVTPVPRNSGCRRGFE